jgi:hypothetical protein
VRSPDLFDRYQFVFHKVSQPDSMAVLSAKSMNFTVDKFFPFRAFRGINDLYGCYKQFR